MQLEELKELRAKARASEESEKTVDKGRPMPSGRPRDFPKSPRFTRYTPLTAHRLRILEEALDVDLMTTPKRTTTPSKHYRYQHKFGHTREDY